MLWATARSSIVEQISAAAIRHRRLFGPLVRRIPRPEPFDGIRAVSAPWRGPALLARPSPANGMRHLGHMAPIACDGIGRASVARDRRYHVAVARHGAPILGERASHRHFRRRGRACALSAYLSSAGPQARRADRLVFSDRL